ncbi:MAG TPA: type II toxin-antitoxin system prevent-host-death family antitoxin [Polyangia bacterium]|jgi:prevent-host-death family protein
MTKPINLYDAKTQLSRLVDRAADGEEIVIAKAGKPRARLVPLAKKSRRKPGLWKGKIWIARDFDAPLPPEILAGFTGGGED